MVGLELPEVNSYRVDFSELKLEAPHCKDLGCDVCLKRWGSYLRTAVRCADGTALEPIPIQRWRCPVHGTTSWLPGFLHRYLHYLVEVVDAVVFELAVTSGRLEALVEITGPAAATAYRWSTELLSDRVHRWILQRLRGPWGIEASKEAFSPERARVIQAAQSFGEELRVADFFSAILQWVRLIHLVRYAE